MSFEKNKKYSSINKQTGFKHYHFEEPLSVTRKDIKEFLTIVLYNDSPT